MMVAVTVEIHESGDDRKFVVRWPWGPEVCYSGTGLRLCLNSANTRIRNWKTKREPFSIPGWDLT